MIIKVFSHQHSRRRPILKSVFRRRKALRLVRHDIDGRTRFPFPELGTPFDADREENRAHQWTGVLQRPEKTAVFVISHVTAVYEKPAAAIVPQPPSKFHREAESPPSLPPTL